MGLTVEVGHLADMMAHDPAGAEWALADFEAINEALQAKSLTAHEEPAKGEPWSADMFGYASLSALREVAALTWAGLSIPHDRLIDGEETDQSDALVADFLEHLSGSAQLTLLGRALRNFFKAKEPPKKPPFLHLIMHSDHDGYYVPVAFETPIVAKRVTDETEHLWPLGSVFGLEAEVNRLANILELPIEMTHQDKALLAFLEAPATASDAALWQAQPLAAHACALLRDACHQSLTTGAAIRFC